MQLSPQRTAKKLKKLREENEILKRKLLGVETILRTKYNVSLSAFANQTVSVFPPDDLMDDFCIIAQETAASQGDG